MAGKLVNLIKAHGGMKEAEGRNDTENEFLTNAHDVAMSGFAAIGVSKLTGNSKLAERDEDEYAQRVDSAIRNAQALGYTAGVQQTDKIRDKGASRGRAMRN